MILLDSKRIERTLKRMAYEIIEEAHGAPVQMVGLNERGFSVARLMHAIIKKETGLSAPLERLDVADETPFSFSRIPGGEPVLVIVDDVIFSGGTIQTAMDKIAERSGFQKVIVAVLVDRGHRKHPVHAAVVGAHIPTKLNEQVNLELNEGRPDKIILQKI